jgi:hypothetical protein
MFNLEMIKYLPELSWENIEVKKIKSYKTDSADYQVKISFRNEGKLPTALKQAHLVKIVTDDKVVLDLDTAGTIPGKPVYKEIKEEKAAKPRESRGGFRDEERPPRQTLITKNVPDTQGGSVTTAIFDIRLFNRTELHGKASVLSTRGGVLKNKEFVIR